MSYYARKFVETHVKIAVEVQEEHGIPALAMLAQSALETGWGRHVSKDIYGGNDSLNLFNIKGEGSLGYVHVRTWEIIDGKKVEIVDHFRAYKSYKESFEDI